MNGSGIILKQRLRGGKDNCQTPPSRPRRYDMWFGLLSSLQTFAIKSMERLSRADAKTNK